MGDKAVSARVLAFRPIPVYIAVAVSCACIERSEDRLSASVGSVSLGEATPLQLVASAVSGLAELAGNRLLVADSRERTIRVVDVMNGVVEWHGSEGGGPEEFLTPGAVLSIDSTAVLVQDRANQRFLRIEAPGIVAGALSVTSDSIWTARPVGVDRYGRLYLEGTALRADKQSVPVWRWDPEEDEVREIFDVDPTDRVVRTSMRGRNTRIRFARQHPYSISDEWGIVGGDRIVVVRADPFAVEVRDLDGQPLYDKRLLQYTAVSVTDRDRERVQQETGSVEWSYPEVKPPIIDRSALTSPDGALWVALHGAADAEFTEFLVIDRHGRILGVASVPVNEQLLGFGPGRAYLAIESNDGLVHIHRRTVQYDSLPNWRR